MAGPVQEISPTLQQVTKRSAEADPKPSPIAKRHAEELKPEQQAQPLHAATALEQQPAADRILGDIAQETAAENQSVSVEVSNEKVAEHLPSSVPSELQTEVNPDDQVGSDLAAGASKLVAEVTASTTATLEESQKMTKIFPEAACNCNGVPAEQNITEPVVKEATETNAVVPEECVKPTGADLSIESQLKDTAPQYLAQPTVQESAEAAPEKAPEAVNLDTDVNVNAEVSLQKPDPVPGTAAAPPLATLTPANPLPQTASTPLIGNIPPQAVESLKVAAQEAASILPLQLTQEVLEQQVSVRTTPLDQPVDQGVAPMEE